MIFYTDRFIPKRFSGVTIGFVTLIRPTHRNDEGLHRHEAVHRKQFLRNPLMPVLYLCSKKKRLQYEVEAFQEQLRYEPYVFPKLAWYLSKNYNLGITPDEAAFYLQL